MNAESRKKKYQKQLEQWGEEIIECESSGKTVNMPVCYSAEHGFNITQLIDFIVDNADSQRKEPCDDDESYSSSSDSTDLVDDILDFTGDVIATAIAVPATIIATPFIIAKSIWDSIFD